MSLTRLFDNIDCQVHIAVAGAAKVIAGSDETPCLFGCNGDFGCLAWFDQDLDVQFFQGEAVSDVFGTESQHDGLTFLQSNLARTERKAFGLKLDYLR